MPTVNYVSPGDVSFERVADSVGLRAHFADKCVLSATVKRIFPLSKPTEYFSIQDGEGSEVAVLRGLDELDEESKRILNSELDRRYFTPRISEIKELKLEAGMWHFLVSTQRGPVDFFVRNWRDNAQEIALNRWQINSVDGARYEILDLEALDSRSRKLMDQLL